MDRTDPPTEIDADTLRRWLAEDDVMLVDVREREEFAREHIPGATLAPLSSFDPRRVAVNAADKRLVVHCLSGARSAQAAATFVAAGLAAPVTLKDGLIGWKRAGLATIAAAG